MVMRHRVLAAPMALLAVAGACDLPTFDFTTTEIRDPDGRPVPTRGSRVVMFDVPPGEDGKVWSFRNYKGWEQVRMLNLPQVFALSPGALLVPSSERR